MTGRQKIQAAFSSEGTPEVPAVICYEGIYIRDHWEQLTDCPWWSQYAPELQLQMRWHRDVIRRTGQDWFHLPVFYSKQEREDICIEPGPELAVRVNRRTGRREMLERPRIGGWSPSRGVHSEHPERLAGSRDEIDAAVPLPEHFDPEEEMAAGKGDLARELVKEFGRELYPISHVGTPLWRCYGLWGFEGMMSMVATQPELVEHACERFLAICVNHVRLAAALGAQAMWLEDCMTDMVSPRAFECLHVPTLRRLVEQVREAGMESIYYYCGDPSDRWELLLAPGADALALEESKKGFTVEIEEVVGRVAGRCAVLGNLDAISVLEKGSRQQLRAEIARQIAAGRQGGSRFIMSLGSPVTPLTPVERVRLYCDLAHELGAT